MTRGARAAAIAASMIFAGCNVDGGYVRFREPKDRISPGPVRMSSNDSVDLATAEPREVDLVEAVAAHRERYRQSLEQLHDYYATHGLAAKRSWAALELAGLRSVKKFSYLLDAEIPSSTLRAKDSIAAADELYEKGLEFMRRGGYGVPAIYRQDRMIEAAAIFREMIQQYPTSDKIDDAAFLCGEIHKEYLRGQEQIAVKWYERAWTWDPSTPHPAKFQAAVVYDYRLHDRDRALELYHAVVEDENSTPGNARSASRRIEELTRDARQVRAVAP
jgi:hypothetical protein